VKKTEEGFSGRMRTMSSRHQSQFLEMISRTHMKGPPASKLDVALAKVCQNCPVCRHARATQKGPAFWFTSKVESSVCPFCRAYERVYGRKAHATMTSIPGSQGS
jgi:hypothetical protein